MHSPPSMHAQSRHVVLQYGVPFNVRDGHTRMVMVQAALSHTHAAHKGLCTLMQSTSVCAHAIFVSRIQLRQC